jgi:hypothetical protein
MLARIGIMRALNRNHVREFNWTASLTGGSGSWRAIDNGLGPK